MIVLLTILGLYCILILVFFAAYTGAKPAMKSNKPVSDFTILIPFRNEAANLPALTACLAKLNYPAGKREIIFIDDHSTDRGAVLIEEFIKTNPGTKLLRLESGRGKKEALKLGIEKSVHNIIVTTDADCQVPQNWLLYFDEAYRAGADMCLGAVRFVGSGYLNDIQQIEQLAVTGTGAGMSYLGHPIMCNGANLSYRRQIFDLAGGFEDNLSIPSGDDQFLLQKVRSSGGRIRFIKSDEHVVDTPSQTDWTGIMNQRLRWAGKWRATGGLLAALTIFIGLAALAFISAWTALIFVPAWFGWVMIITVLKFLSEFLLAGAISQTLGIKVPWLTYPIFAVLYPVYAVYLSIRSNIGQYEWKGRRYSTG